MIGGVEVRFGIHTGPVVVGKIGDNLRMDYTAVGNTTNLAARLQQQAEPGAIRVSEATRRVALAHFEFAPLGRLALKGIGEPVEVYDLLHVRAAHSAIEQVALRVTCPSRYAA
jgi:class 3 adenylate cyclase